MTISTTGNSQAYAGSGTAPFNFPFKFFANSDLIVTRNNGVTVTQLTLGADYLVSGAGSEFGGVVTPLASETGNIITITRQLPRTQELDLNDLGAFPAEATERAFDKLTMLFQEALDNLTRSLQRPIGGVDYDAANGRIINVAAPVLSTDAANLATVQAQISAGGGNVPSPLSNQVGGLIRASGVGTFNWWMGSQSVVSAATVDLAASTSPVVLISGTSTITSFGTPTNAGDLRYVVFTGAMTLTHDPNAIILPTSANITTASGDTAIFSSRGGGLGWRCIIYSRGNGKTLVAPAAADITDSTSIGRALLTAATTAAQRTSLGIGQLFSSSFSIANNAVISIDVSGFAVQSGIISIATTVPTVASGQVAFRCPSGSAGLKLSGPATLVGTTGVLTGTTGSVGNCTVSAHTDSRIYIENRAGFPLNGSYLLQIAG